MPKLELEFGRYISSPRKDPEKNEKKHIYAEWLLRKAENFKLKRTNRTKIRPCSPTALSGRDTHRISTTPYFYLPNR
jgi:hypothetical protein